MTTEAATSHTHLVKVCGNCERELGRQHLEPDQVASHGVCKRHLLEFVRPVASPSYLQHIEAQHDDAFCPDLAKHPELVETPTNWRPERGVFKNLTTINDERGGIVTKV